MANVVGVKWSSYDQKFALSMYRRYADQLNFIDNDMPAALSLPAKLGATGFVNSDLLVAPRFVLHEWELFRDRRYDELDELLLRTLRRPVPGPRRARGRRLGRAWARARMRERAWRRSACGWDPRSRRSSRSRPTRSGGSSEGYRRSGIHEWVDWSEELWEDARTASRVVAAAAR